MKVLIADTFEQSGLDAIAAAGCELIYRPEIADEKLAAVLTTDGKTLVVSGIKRRNRKAETMDAKQLAEHIGKRAQRGKLADVGFRTDRLGE